MTYIVQRTILFYHSPSCHSTTLWCCRWEGAENKSQCEVFPMVAKKIFLLSSSSVIFYDTEAAGWRQM